MKIYHRVVGDPPQRGFDVSLVTPGFPLTAQLANIKKARLPISEVPFEKKAEPGVTQLVEQHRAFEVQPMAFGQLVAIHSAVGCMGAARAHYYTDFALPMLEEGLFTDTLSAGQLLTFDRFVPLENFWQIDSNTNVLPIDEWLPPADAGFNWAKPVPEGFRNALLAQYWRAVTQSVFGGKLEPVRVCLSDETDCLRIIEEAKAFFATVIAPGLPRVTQNIMSMSAPVPQRFILQAYPGSALVFLYPEEKLNCEFDLRTGRYRHSTEDEVAMIAHLLAGGQIELLTGMLERFQAEKGAVKPEHCSFLADYDVALTAFRLENHLAKPDELPRLWRLLGEYLAQRHGLGEDTANRMMIGADAIIVQQLLIGDLPAFAPDEARLLMRKALAADGTLKDDEIELLARHQAARQQPFIADLLLETQPINTQRATELLRHVLLRGYVEEPLDQQQRDKLASDQFSSMCKPHAEMRAVMAEYIMKAGKRHSQNTLFMLPLSMQYLNGQELLTQTLNLLGSSYVERLPDRAMCADIQASWKNHDIGHAEQLDAYYVDCIWMHLGNLDPLKDVIIAIGEDISNALQLFFAKASGRVEKLDTPMTPRQFEEIMKTLISMSKDEAAVYAGLLGYVDAVLARSLQTGQNRFDWFAELRAASIVQTDKAFDERGINYLLDFGNASGVIPGESSFQALLFWLRSGRLQAQQGAEGRLKQLYEKYGDKGKKQLRELIPLLGSTVGYPYLVATHGELIREKLLAGTATKAYWIAVESIRSDLVAAGLTADAMLTEDVQERLARTLDHHFRNLDTVSKFLNLYNGGCQKTADGFQTLWIDRLAAAFRGQYDTVLTNALNNDAEVIRRRSEPVEGVKHDGDPTRRGNDMRDGATHHQGASAGTGMKRKASAPSRQPPSRKDDEMDTVKASKHATTASEDRRAEHQKSSARNVAPERVTRQRGMDPAIRPSDAVTDVPSGQHSTAGDFGPQMDARQNRGPAMEYAQDMPRSQTVMVPAPEWDSPTLTAPRAIPQIAPQVAPRAVDGNAAPEMVATDARTPAPRSESVATSCERGIASATSEGMAKDYWQFKKLGELFSRENRASSPARAGEGIGLRPDVEPAHRGSKLMVEALDWVITTLEQDLPKLSGDAVVNCARNAMMELQRHQDKAAYHAMRSYLLAAMLQEPQHRQRLRTMNFERKLAFSMVCCTSETSVLFAEQLLNAMVDWPEEAIRAPFSHLEQLTTVCALFEQMNRYGAVYPDLLRQCLQNTERWKDYAARVRADRRQASECFPWLADGDAQDDFHIPRAMREWLVNANAKTTARKDDF